jgi:hypothetical protein
MRNAIKYRNCWLMAGSVAHKLHTEGKLKELDAHMKEMDRKDKKLKGTEA